MSGNVVNLDKLAAQHAQKTIQRTKAKNKRDPLSSQQKPADVDNSVTKAFGVLQENGVYACALYLLSRTQETEQDIARVVTDEMLTLLSSLGFAGWEKPYIDWDDSPSEAVLSYLSEHVTGGDLERLLLAKETLEQMLVYARYGAQARKAEEKNS